jgi:hypothetical protein
MSDELLDLRGLLARRPVIDDFPAFAADRKLSWLPIVRDWAALFDQSFSFGFFLFCL